MAQIGTKIKMILIVALSVALVGCGTLTGIPSHGGGKRFAVEQRLVSTTIRGAIKEIDLSSLRDKTVFLQITSINDQGAGNMMGGRASLLFALQGLTESSPITGERNTFKVFDLSTSGNSAVNQAVSGGSTTHSSSASNSAGNSSNTSNTESASNGNSTSSSDSSGSSTNTSTSTNNGSGTNTSTTTNTGSGTNTNTSTTNGSGTTDTTTQTGGTTTTQDGENTHTSTTTNNGSSTNTNTSTTNGSGTNTSTNTTDGSSTDTSSSTSDGSTAQNSNSSTNSGSETDQQSSSSSSSNTNHFQNAATTSRYGETRQELAPHPEQKRTQTKGTGYKGSYGVSYQGQGNYQNFNVPVSDVGILQSIIRTYFYLNDVKVTTDPNNPAIEAIVNINIDVFGSIRSRLDTVLYNKETVRVQTVLEVMAVDYRDHSLMMMPQTGAYEAVYDEKYTLWVGPLNRRSTRITHHSMNEGLLVNFNDIAQAKLERDQQKKSGHHRYAGETSANTPEQTVNSAAANQQQAQLVAVQKMIASWLHSWQQSNVADYLSHYSAAFTPQQGMSRQQWQEQRTHKLTANQNIQIVPRNMQVRFSPDNRHVKVSFMQHYQSASYQDQVFKTLLLVREGHRWLIVSESTHDEQANLLNRQDNDQ